MAVDYGLFKALTGPLVEANKIQQNRDAVALQQRQQEEQQFLLEERERGREQALQGYLDGISKETHKLIFGENGKFKRDKDVSDYSKWHSESSGWKEIESILKQYNTIPNAYRHGKLDEALAHYKRMVTTPDKDPTKGNPLLLRASENFQSLEAYNKYALDKEYGQYITSNSRQRYKDWKEGKTDNFIYTGVRGDYLENVVKDTHKGDNIDIDEVIARNHTSIMRDMEADLGQSRNTFSDQDVRNWLAGELAYTVSGGVGYFGDKAYYGEKDIETDYATELTTGIEATGKMGLSTGRDVFNIMDKGVSFKQAFDDQLSIDWDRLGGYDHNSEVHSTMGLKSPFSKGLQLIASGQVLTNDRNLETAVTNSWAGTYDDNKTPRYNSKNRQIYGVQMEGLYDRRGHKITDSDISSSWLPTQHLWQESSTDNLKLTGYHIALEGKNANGDSFLLTNVQSKEDMAKLKEQYKNVQFSPVMVAELIDDDLGPDDAYYKKIDMSQPSLRSSINNNISSEELNKTLNQMADYEQKAAQKSYENKQQIAYQQRLIKQMDLPGNAELDQVILAYDQSLAVGLGTAGVPSTKIRQAIPMIIADLHVASRNQKEFPVVIEKDASGRITKQANNASELMAYRAQQLKTGLTRGMSGFEQMLEAIREGNYDAYRKGTMDSKTYNDTKALSKDISKYYNTK